MSWLHVTHTLMTNSNKHSRNERRGPNALAVQTFINAVSLIKTSEKAFGRYTRLINAGTHTSLSLGSNRTVTQDWIFVYLLLIFYLLSFFCCCRSSLHFSLITPLGLTTDFPHSFVFCFSGTWRSGKNDLIILGWWLIFSWQNKCAHGDWNTVWCVDQKVHRNVRCLSN